MSEDNTTTLTAAVVETTTTTTTTTDVVEVTTGVVGNLSQVRRRGRGQGPGVMRRQ